MCTEKELTVMVKFPESKPTVDYIRVSKIRQGKEKKRDERFSKMQPSGMSIL